MRRPTANHQNQIMFRFGIQNYRPHWLRGRDSITTSHGRRLARLAGLTLQHVWLLWDLTDDEWFTDAPVLLQFGDEQVEIDHQKFDDVSITWNTINPAQKIEDDFFHLAWRPEPLPPLTELPGQTLDHVELLEWSSGPNDMANGSIALGFNFPPAWLTIFNALDENGVSHDLPHPHYRRHRIDRQPEHGPHGGANTNP
jgi:hypothetical protein